MNDTLPPSVRRQEWGLIAGIAGTAFVISISLLFYYTWHLGSDWGHFSEHWPALWGAIKDLVLRHSLASWMHYWQQIVDYGWKHYFIAHTGLPTLAALLVAVIILVAAIVCAIYQGLACTVTASPFSTLSSS